METAAELVRNLSQRLLNFLDRMEGISGDETPQLRSASASDRDMGQVGPELDTSDEDHRVAAPDNNGIFGGFYTGEHRRETSLNMPGVATANRNDIFDRFYTGEDHDDSSRRMPGRLWSELPSPPGRFPPGPIPPPPPMQAGGANNIFGHFYTGETHDDFSFTENLFNDAGPAPVLQAGANFLNQLPDLSLDDIPNVTGCNICMEPFGSTEDPESPVQLPCGHVMGRKCISRWLETSNSCPLCRHVLFEQGRGFIFEQEGSFLFGQQTFNRSWDNLEPRLQELIRSMTAQEQRHLLQALQESTPLETMMDLREQSEELEAYWVEYREISLQRAAIDTRLAELEAGDSLLTSQRATELRELEEDNEVLRARLDSFHGRYRDLIESN